MKWDGVVERERERDVLNAWTDERKKHARSHVCSNTSPSPNNKHKPYNASLVFEAVTRPSCNKYKTLSRKSPLSNKYERLKHNPRALERWKNPCARRAGAVVFLGPAGVSFENAAGRTCRSLTGCGQSACSLRAERYINTAGAVWASESNGRFAEDGSAPLKRWLDSGRTRLRVYWCASVSCDLIDTIATTTTAGMCSRTWQ